MPRTKRDPRLVAALLYEDLCTFEFGLAAEVFGLKRPEMGADWYKFLTCAESLAPIRAGGGVAVIAEADLSGLDRAGTIVIPGWCSENSAPSQPVAQSLRRAHFEGARLVTICSGAFLLAELGLLDGRSATTHWRYTDRLHQRFPAVNVQPEVLYVDGDDILTSAGSAAGIDLLLHVVRKDFGAEAANNVARRLVMPPHRDGGQLQFIGAPVPAPRDGRLSNILDAIRAEPARDWSLAEMSKYARMSTRTFCRKFLQLTGVNPGEWLIATRVAAARRILETMRAPLADVAEVSGLGSVENLVRQFRKRVGVAPRDYRRAFGAERGAAKDE